MVELLSHVYTMAECGNRLFTILQGRRVNYGQIEEGTTEADMGLWNPEI